MHDGDLWQVFEQNGQPIEGCGEVAATFAADPALVMGNAHVWLWCQRADDRAVLLQKRSQSLMRSPGKYHVSAAGHIDLGETPVETAVRETKEEMNVTLDSQKLYFVQTIRGGRAGESLNTVFTYQVDEDTEFSFDDGEVDSVRWVGISEFERMTHSADGHNLIDQGRAYFDAVIASIKRQ